MAMRAGTKPLVFSKASRTFTFAGHTLDLDRGSLTRGTEEVKLRPKSYETLKFLVENAGRLVPKAELIAVLWPDAAVVSEDSLTHCIMDVRRALEDHGQQIIRTFPGRGYLFAAPIQNYCHTAEALPTPADNPAAWSIRKPAAIGLVLTLVIIASLGLFLRERSRRKWAHESVPRVEELAAAGKYAEAYDLARQLLSSEPAEPRIASLMSELSDDLSVMTKPAGAEVYLRRLGSVRPERVGVTPIDHLRIARAEYILSLRKTGYADFERTVSSALERLSTVNRTPWKIRLELDLRETSKIPQNMAAIPAGEYSLRNHSRPTEASVKLGEYFIDRFEVSNRDFKAFVDAGGYRNRRLWEPAFYDDKLGPVQKLTDKTGMPGPRVWIGGTFPAGKEMYPVTGITWHEALAYCRSRGKDLPTLFQWEKAAKPSVWVPFGVIFPWGLLDPKDVASRANVDSTGLAPVDSFEFGMSSFGVYNMAGNAAEWIRNGYDDGYTIAGGAWNDPAYGFLHYNRQPAVYSSESLGCRCALAAAAAGDQGGMPLSTNGEVLHYPVSSERDFQASAARYAYEHAPLNAAILGAQESTGWRREEIAFDGEGGQRAKAFLYLPRNSSPPYQVIHYLSGAAWWFGVPITDAVETSGRLSPYLRGGRAVFLVALEGFSGRESGKYAKIYDNHDFGSAAFRDGMASWVRDMQRSFDYLETRSDIDARKVAFWNDSTYQVGVVMAAVNHRYSSVIMVGCGGESKSLVSLPADINPFQFAPHIRAPKLLMNGRYDDRTIEHISFEPFYQMLSMPKKRVRFEGGHMPPPEIAVPIINGFLDETLGPVKR
jgi:formylglycine-generating enzyme required for sulfatase activity/DNA-binding winged helix-turn-helix (wHTH) protein